MFPLTSLVLNFVQRGHAPRGRPLTWTPLLTLPRSRDAGYVPAFARERAIGASPHRTVVFPLLRGASVLVDLGLRDTLFLLHYFLRPRLPPLPPLPRLPLPLRRSWAIIMDGSIWGGAPIAGGPEGAPPGPAWGISIAISLASTSASARVL